MDVLTLRAILGIDTSEYDRGLQAASGKMNSFGGALKTGFGTIAKVGTAALTAATGAATAFAKSAIDSSISYETAFTGVMKTVEETGTTSYAMLSDSIKQMATETASSQEAIAGVMEAAGQLGISADDIVGFTETMVKLGDTTNLEAAEAAVALAHFTNITGESSANVDKLGAAIVDLGNNFATDEASIVEMSTRLASAGTLAGLTSTDILGLSTAMSSVGINAEAGGTAMSQALNKISKYVANGSDELYEIAEVAGISAEEFADAWEGDPVHAFATFIKGLNEVTEAGGNTNGILEDLGMKGIRESNTLRSLALAADMLDDSIETANRAYGENNALNAEAEKRYKTTESRIIQMKNAFKNLKIEIGEELSPVLGEFIDFGTNGIKKVSEAFKEGGIDGAIAAIGDVLADGITMVTEKLPEMIDAGMKLLGALGQGIVQNAPAIFNAFLQISNQIGDAILHMMIEGFYSLESFDWAGTASNIANWLTDAFSGLENFLNMGFMIISELASGIGEALPELLPAVVGIVLELVKDITENAGQMVDAAIALAEGLQQGLIDSIPVICEAAPEIITALAAALIENLPKLLEAQFTMKQSIIDAIVQSGPEVAGSWGESWNGVVDVIAEKGTEFVAKVAEVLGQVLSTLEQILPQLPEKMAYWAGYAIGEFIKFFLELGPKLSDTFNNAMSKVQEFGNQMRAKAPEIAKGFINSIVSGLRALPEQMKNIGAQAVQGIWQGISSGWSWLTSQVKSLADSLVQGVKDSLQIHSPSRVFMEIGEQVDRGFALGIRNNSNMVMNALGDLTTTPTVNFTNDRLVTGGMTQYLTINSPQPLDPSEIARQTRNANREMYLQLRMA